MLKASVRLARRTTKVDWVLRDIYLKILDNIAAEGTLQDILEFQEHVIRKYRQDTSHFIFQRRVMGLLQQAGFLVAELKSLNGYSLADLVAITPEGKLWIIELKSGMPPWVLNNLKEHELYHEIYNKYDNVKILYIWHDWRRENSPIYAADFLHIGFSQDKVVVNEHTTLENLLLRWL